MPSTAAQAAATLTDSRLALVETEAEVLRRWDLDMARILTPDLMRDAEGVLGAFRERFLPKVERALREVVRIEAGAQAEILGKPGAKGRAVRKSGATVDVVWEAFVSAGERADRNLAEALDSETTVLRAMGMGADATLRSVGIDRQNAGPIFRGHRADWRDALRALFRRVGSAVAVTAAREVSGA